MLLDSIQGQRVMRILDAAAAAASEHCRRVATATLNMVVRDGMSYRTPPTSHQGRRGRIYYATQVCPYLMRLCTHSVKAFTS